MILPSLSAKGVSVLTRKSGLLLSYRCFALKLSPGGYGAARLWTDFPFLPKVAPEQSTSSPAWHRRLSATEFGVGGREPVL